MMTRTVKEEALIQLILSRLNQNRLTSGQTIDVVVVDGEVNLVGWCDTEEEKLAAEQIVRGTYGVRTVTVSIRVRRIAQSI